MKKEQIASYNALIDELEIFVSEFGRTYNPVIEIPEKLTRQALLDLPPEIASELFQQHTLRAHQVAFEIGLNVCKAFGLWFEFNLQESDPHIKFYSNATWEGDRFIGVEDEEDFSKHVIVGGADTAHTSAIKVYSHLVRMNQ